MSYNGPERRRRKGNAVIRALTEFGSDPPPEARWHHIWRDFVPLVALVIAAFAVLGVESKVDQAAVDATVAKRVAAAQRSGRGVSIGIICGALRGVEDAGRLVLTNQLPGTERYRQPSSPRERRVREVYARAYNEVITRRIVDEAGATGERVIRADGSVDCDELRVAAGTQPPP